MKALMVVSCVVVVLLGSMGGWATGYWAPSWGGTVVPLAGATNLGAFWVAFVPVAVVMRRGQVAVVQALLMATGIRMLLVAGVTVAATIIGPWPAMVLSAWMIFFYFCLLAIETGWTIWLVNRKTETTNGPASL